MRLTKEQKEELLPLLRKAVQAKIDQWEAEHDIEAVLGRMFDGMNDAIEPFAVSYDSGAEVRIADVVSYVDTISEEN